MGNISRTIKVTAAEPHRTPTAAEIGGCSQVHVRFFHCCFHHDAACGPFLPRSSEEIASGFFRNFNEAIPYPTKANFGEWSIKMAFQVACKTSRPTGADPHVRGVTFRSCSGSSGPVTK